MERINIENLFDCKTNSDSHLLDIKVITQGEKPFNIDTLIETRERRRKILLDHYVKFYNSCLKKIEIANKLGRTDLLFSINDFIPNCPEFKPRNCLEYIREKLQTEYFNICILNDRTLFITWLYLEANIKILPPLS